MVEIAERERVGPLMQTETVLAGFRTVSLPTPTLPQNCGEGLQQLKLIAAFAC